MDKFDLQIDYNGETKSYPCTVQRFSYTYRFTVSIDDRDVIFEPDEEGQLRARLENMNEPSRELKEQIRLVGEELQQLMKDR